MTSRNQNYPQKTKDLMSLKRSSNSSLIFSGTSQSWSCKKCIVVINIHFPRRFPALAPIPYRGADLVQKAQAGPAYCAEVIRQVRGNRIRQAWPYSFTDGQSSCSGSGSQVGRRRRAQADLMLILPYL